MAVTPNYSWVTPAPTDLVTDLPADFEIFADAVDATVFSNAGAAINKTIVDAKGDLIVGTAADTVARLAAGTNGFVLTANSATGSGLEWAAGGSGKLKQVVTATTTTTTGITATTYTDVTNLTATITPTSASSTILVLVQIQVLASRSTNNTIRCDFNLVRGATQIYEVVGAMGIKAGTSAGSDIAAFGSPTLIYVDSPATTSARTYKVQGQVSTNLNSGQLTVNSDPGSTSSITLLEIGA
jgi:hypothetical protein